MSIVSEVIGFSLGYNTSAALVDSNQGVVLAISEERLINEKNTKWFPINAIKKCVDKYRERQHVEPKVFIFGISHYEIITMRCIKYIPDNDLEHIANSLNLFNVKDIHGMFFSFYDLMEYYIRLKCDIPDDAKVIIKRADHHTSHMLPAYYLSGFEDDEDPTISVVGDGFGDGVSLTVFDHKRNEYIAKEPLNTSIGLVYQYVTGALGFKEHQHEGKITGLAAFGEPKYEDHFRKFIIDFDISLGRLNPVYLKRDARIEYPFSTYEFINTPENDAIIGFDEMITLKNAVYNLVTHLKQKYNAKREDIAASVQMFAENMVVNVVSYALFRAGYVSALLPSNDGIRKVIHPIVKNEFNLTLSGGLFANVKINYYVKKLTGAKSIYVLPPMGDEGTSIGAALNILQNGLPYNKEISMEPLNWFDAYLGNLYLGDKEEKSSLDEINGEEYDCILFEDNSVDTITNLISELLSRKMIVCISRGKAEFGPRALCNHSILYDASEKETNDSLNARLSRTEFMPFAPVSLDKFSNDLYFDLEGLEKPTRYMTVSVPVKMEFLNNYKAAYHIDMTARPQILSRNDNPFIYEVMEKYYKATGKKVLINTSFNLHNYPIIYSDKVAYESFDKADLDALVLDKMIIVKKGIL